MNPHQESTATVPDRTVAPGGSGPVIVPFVAPVVAPTRRLDRALGDEAPEVGPAPFRSARVSRVVADGVVLGRPDEDAEPALDSSSNPVVDETLPSTGGADALSDTIRRWARPTTVDELRSRGVRNLRSISMNRVGALIEKAVNRALIERTLGSDTGEALSLSSTAREQFVRLSRAASAAPKLDDSQNADFAGEADDEDEAPLHERATSTLDRLRRELEGRRQLLADREKQLSDGDLDRTEDSALSEQLRELFATFAGVDDRRLEQDVLNLVSGELHTSRRRARIARLEEHQREIGTLERRIAKLSVLLGETEDALRRVRSGKKADLGVSSIYDEVQGLGHDDEQFEQKSELMKCLFEANMALRS